MGRGAMFRRSVGAERPVGRSACLTSHLRLGLAFGQAPTGRTLTFGALVGCRGKAPARRRPRPPIGRGLTLSPRYRPRPPLSEQAAQPPLSRHVHISRQNQSAKRTGGTAAAFAARSPIPENQPSPRANRRRSRRFRGSFAHFGKINPPSDRAASPPHSRLVHASRQNQSAKRTGGAAAAFAARSHISAKSLRPRANRRHSRRFRGSFTHPGKINPPSEHAASPPHSRLVRASPHIRHPLPEENLLFPLPKRKKSLPSLPRSQNG